MAESDITDTTWYDQDDADMVESANIDCSGNLW